VKLRTFVATYLLFLGILFSSLGIVSVYMTGSQINMLKDKSAAEYQTIAASLAKDIAVLSGRNADTPESVSALARAYAKYYSKNNITIALTDLSLTTPENSSPVDPKISFVSRNQSRSIFITSTLPEPFQYYKLDYFCDITTNIADMRNIQNILLLISVAFSVITALALYFMLSNIFRPLGIVSKASRKIAGGQYDERIRVKGKNELSSMAADFNRMADEIEKQMRLLEEEAAGKQQFVDNFAHEIRTPLTSVYGYAEYMQKAALDEEEVIDSARFIRDAASHMKKIADSLLELATLRNYKPVISKISIPQLFDDISQTMKKSLDERNVRLVCRSSADFLDGQEDLIKSLLLNLCSNALAACAPDSSIINLEAEKLGGNIVLSVSDNGCGIPEESVPKVTEPFYRVDKSRNREQGGAGLGLALCGQIAAAHNAEMVVKSAVGKGTTVKIIFTSS